MDTLVIRRFKSSDKQKVKDLYEVASLDSEIGYRSGPWEEDLDDIEGHFLNGGEFLVGLIGEQVVVMAGYRKISDHVGQLRRMRTHPDHRRKGYALQIIQKLEEEAARNKITEMRLKTSTRQKMAQSFYEKNGYKRMKMPKEYYTEGGGNSFEVVWYTKKLA